VQRSDPALRFEDVEPILDGDAWGFYLVFRVEGIEKNPNMLDRLVFEPFFQPSDPGPRETEEVSAHGDSSDPSFLHFIISANQSARRLVSLLNDVEA